MGFKVLKWNYFKLEPSQIGKLFEQVISRKIVDFYKYNEFSNHEKISKEKHELVYKYKVYKSKWRDSIVALKCFTSNDKYLNKKVVDELDVKNKLSKTLKNIKVNTMIPF
ncbi:20372_t:CDS:2 [Dentiscutata erythropus]|uniref:20372_t:CDS:1 n=1 Tax=Dentiscutata erythropus TaxID=1348616 RepID=A0A9N9A721_9GLOM|nr:20372_t:CDS:2 [Dentiscutata erythropus]